MQGHLVTSVSSSRISWVSQFYLSFHLYCLLRTTSSVKRQVQLPAKCVTNLVTHLLLDNGLTADSTSWEILLQLEDNQHLLFCPLTTWNISKFKFPLPKVMQARYTTHSLYLCVILGSTWELPYFLDSTENRSPESLFSSTQTPWQEKSTGVTPYPQQLCLQKKSLSWSQKAASLWSSLFQGYER